MVIKNIIGFNALLCYPNFSEILIIHTDSIKIEFGRVIRNMRVPLSFTHRNKTQLNKLYNYSKKTVQFSGNHKE